eukprot:CAMPEP_0194031536 /NCGR_PEP_ID=MMETSP0009_2-20130614/4690_1 /TAXON_ID=210454 /ORGANISM="Grammatophora oceanica, Strain CCMP 410" /LENGTH=288 /DNA_ID=CAMNT_0038671727 /DNA_START=16 /DNA_END=882 /DNA_ORIENTATION=+
MTISIWHSRSVLLLLVFVTAFHPATSFAPRRPSVAQNAVTSLTTTTTPKTTPSSFFFVLHAMNEDSLPETSFGADAVPEGQRPVNEYLNLIRAPLFGWASTSTPGLLLRLAAVYAISFGAICYPIAGATFTQEEYELQKLAAANLGSLALLAFIMLRLYTGWTYVGSRLKSKVIDYEETGWYDGDFETKGEAERQRDIFLYKSDVKPVEDRLTFVSIGLMVMLLGSTIGFNVANNAHPLFDEYNPDMLERVRYDDDLAQFAAKNAAGKPAYCDSRYYRAVANGGQGCD